MPEPGSSIGTGVDGTKAAATVVAAFVALLAPFGSLVVADEVRLVVSTVPAATPLSTFATIVNWAVPTAIFAALALTLVGRIDVKAFRDAGALRVKAFWPEAGVRLTKGRLAKLATELDRLAVFSGCERVEFLDGWERETLPRPTP